MSEVKFKPGDVVGCIGNYPVSGVTYGSLYVVEDERGGWLRLKGKANVAYPRASFTLYHSTPEPDPMPAIDYKARWQNYLTHLFPHMSDEGQKLARVISQAVFDVRITQPITFTDIQNGP